MSYIIPDVLRQITDNISSDLLPELQDLDGNITGIHFDHGHPLEIIETLMQKDKSGSLRFQKYPLICLFEDFPKISDSIEYDFYCDLHLIIAKSTKPEYKAEERKANNFQPYLWPIWDEFFKGIQLHPAFMETGKEIRKEVIDRYFWGRGGLFTKEGNLFNDWIDCIEVKMKLKVNFKNC